MCDVWRAPVVYLLVTEMLAPCVMLLHLRLPADVSNMDRRKKNTAQYSSFYNSFEIRKGAGSSSRSSHPPHERRPFVGEGL